MAFKNDIKVAVLGYGTVGSAVCEGLLKNEGLIRARCGATIKPVVAVARSQKPAACVPVSTDLDEVLDRDDIDIFVELMGGVDTAFSAVKSLLARAKPVISANKAMLAHHRYELAALAKNTFFGYEASVAGGLPIIKVLKEGLCANAITRICGILNGTSNFILSSMSESGESFEAALKEAQRLGYAEADPTFDIEGLDAAHKLLVLSSLAFGLKARPDDILIEGITQISSEDMFFAHEFDYAIKLLGVAKCTDGGSVELRVHPAMVDRGKMLAKVGGVMNAVSVVGDLLGESLYYGAGAGGAATASAVISDLMDFARLQNARGAMLGFEKEPKFTLTPRGEIYTKYYLRLKVEDRVGVLSKITQLMSAAGISVDSFLQKPKKSSFSTLYFTTHHSFERQIGALLGELAKQDFVKEKPFMMRIEQWD